MGPDKYKIKLDCGHFRKVFYPKSKNKEGYFCNECHCARTRDDSFPPEKVKRSNIY